MFPVRKGLIFLFGLAHHLSVSEVKMTKAMTQAVLSMAPMANSRRKLWLCCSEDTGNSLILTISPLHFPKVEVANKNTASLDCHFCVLSRGYCCCSGKCSPTVWPLGSRSNLLSAGEKSRTACFVWLVLCFRYEPFPKC